MGAHSDGGGDGVPGEVADLLGLAPPVSVLVVVAGKGPALIMNGTLTAQKVRSGLTTGSGLRTFGSGGEEQPGVTSAYGIEMPTAVGCDI